MGDTAGVGEGLFTTDIPNLLIAGFPRSFAMAPRSAGSSGALMIQGMVTLSESSSKKQFSLLLGTRLTSHLKPPSMRAAATRSVA